MCHPFFYGFYSLFFSLSTKPSSLKKILTVVGARPQFIKAAAFSRKLREYSDWREVIVHTGQHFDANMSEVFFKEMDIPKPDHQLAINSLGHGAMTGRMLEGLEKIMLTEKPDWVLVYGDTNSTLAGALAAKKLRIPVAHVEAGLRSFDERMPEETNRVLTDRMSDLLFVPSAVATRNLAKEGVDSSRIYEVGDIMLDAVQYYASKSAEKNTIGDQLPDRFVLLTLHRQENTDDEHRLRTLVDALNKLAEEATIIFPVHPRTRKKLSEQGLTLNARMIDPVGYLDMLELIRHSQLVLTDSGGLQKEAFYLDKFCITLRDNTEWTELADLDVNRLVGADSAKLLQAYTYFSGLKKPGCPNPYGDGKTAGNILKILRAQF